MKRVLFIEDALDFRDLLIDHFKSQYEMIGADTLEEARNALAQASVDLILLDVNLPDGTGFDFCKELRSNPKTAATPIIFLTGQMQLNEKIEGLSVGADDYVTKPCEIDELRARMDALLRRSP